MSGVGAGAGRGVGDGEGLGDGDGLGDGVGVGPEGESTAPHETTMTASNARPAARTADGMALLYGKDYTNETGEIQNAEGERDRAGVSSRWLRIATSAWPVRHISLARQGPRGVSAIYRRVGWTDFTRLLARLRRLSWTAPTMPHVHVRRPAPRSRCGSLRPGAAESPCDQQARHRVART